jgi:hypothetical protein
MKLNRSFRLTIFDSAVTSKRLSQMVIFEKVDAYDEITGWQTFTRDDAVEFYVKNNSVVCIACFGDCVIEGFI